jgi:acyl-CoA dehydrogenase
MTVMVTAWRIPSAMRSWPDFPAHEDFLDRFVGAFSATFAEAFFDAAFLAGFAGPFFAATFLAEAFFGATLFRAFFSGFAGPFFAVFAFAFFAWVLFGVAMVTRGYADATASRYPARSMATYFFETEEHASLRAQARRFAEREIAPHAHAWEEAEEFPRELYGKLAETGLMGLGYPAEHGGGGGDVTHVLVASEELVLAGKSVGTVVGLGSHGIALPPIVKFGTEEQIDRFVRPVLRGEKIAALAITEPSGGSDVASLRTKAVRDGDHYVVTGAKTFITSGVRADFVTCAVRTGGPQHGGISMLVIERGTPGFSVSKKLKKTGWWASDTAELHFEECRVPAKNLIGDENAGFVAIMANFVTERLFLAGQCVAIAELAHREALAYARERQAFGKSLTAFQVTRHKLADMATRIAAARALTAEVAMRYVRGEQAPQLAAMAKNTATDMCTYVVDQAVQIHGGYGYMREYVVERLFRDARLYPIGGGTREIMNEIISKAEGY